MKLFALVTTCLVFCGCFKTRSEVAEAEDKQSAETVSPAPASPEKNQRAEDGLRIQNNESTLREMNGRIEVLEHKLEQMEQQKTTPQDSQAQQSLAEQMKLFQDQIAKMDQRMTAIEAQSNVRPTTPRGGFVVTPGSPSDVDNSKDSVIWVEAEKYFNQKDWRKAILSYQKYRDENPKGANFAEATYKIGVSFQEMGKKEEAKAFFDEVMEKFPKSKAARKAQYRVKTIK